MTIQNGAILLSYDGEFEPLFNPGSKGRFSDPIGRLTQSFIEHGGFNQSLGADARIAGIDAKTMVGKTLPDTLTDLVAAFRHKNHRGRKWKFAVPNDSPEAGKATAELDSIQSADNATKFVTITLEDCADMVELLYRTGDKWKSGLKVIVSMQGRWVAQIAYLAYRKRLLGDKFDLATELKSLTFTFTKSEAKTVEQLELEIIMDNSNTGKADYPLAETIQNWIRVKRTDLRLSSNAIAIKLGGMLVDSAGKPKNGINDKCRGVFRLVQRHGEAINLYGRLVNRMPETASYEAGKSPVPADKLNKQDMTWLTNHVTERTKMTGPIKEVFKASGLTEAAFRKANAACDAVVVERYLEYVSFGTIDGEEIVSNKNRQALSSDQLKKVQETLKEAGQDKSFSMPVYQILELILTGDDGTIERMAAENMPKLT